MAGAPEMDDMRRGDGMHGGDRAELPGIWLALLALGLAAPLLPLAPPAHPVPGIAAARPVVRAVAPRLPARAVVLADVVSAPGRTVALTFDDGPHARWTREVLAVLHRSGAVATFCMIADKVPGNEDVVREVVDAGMRLCDHSRTHAELTTAPDPVLNDEVTGAQASIKAAAGGAPVGYFRAPHGRWTPHVLDLAAAHGMQPLGWSIDPDDWRRPGVAAIVEQVRRQVRPGAVILFHDGGGPRDQTVAALEQLLPWLVDQGYRFGFPSP
jgi:peptidoglycan-N-acetylglucosamine deacetylase